MALEVFIDICGVSATTREIDREWVTGLVNRAKDRKSKVWVSVIVRDLKQDINIRLACGSAPRIATTTNSPRRKPLTQLESKLTDLWSMLRCEGGNVNVQGVCDFIRYLEGCQRRESDEKLKKDKQWH
ncbi:hypothetical protein [Vibrio harveyi]|uniref:hypothetical protein n=1 Tax=Vibrio harveyi TaxID=669 RepID=UPI0006824B44|nr:hypothetical protein [Vibrio harveyi]